LELAIDRLLHHAFNHREVAPNRPVVVPRQPLKRAHQRLKGILNDSLNKGASSKQKRQRARHHV